MNIFTKSYIHPNGWCEYTMGIGQAIVMLHGFGYSAEVMFPLASMLSKNFQVILFDLPGFGKSSYNFHELSLEIIISELAQIAPPYAHYIGWSIGGHFTQYFASKYPQRIRKLIAIASSPCFVAHNHWPGISKTVLDHFKMELKENFKSAIKKFIWDQLYPKSKVKYQTLLELVFKNIPKSSGIYLAYLNLLMQTNLTACLSLIKANQLYLLGKMDPLVPSHINLYQYNPNIKCVLLDSGHLPFISHLHQTAEIIEAFLNES